MIGLVQVQLLDVSGIWISNVSGDPKSDVFRFWMAVGRPIVKRTGFRCFDIKKLDIFPSFQMAMRLIYHSRSKLENVRISNGSGIQIPNVVTFWCFFQDVLQTKDCWHIRHQNVFLKHPANSEGSWAVATSVASLCVLRWPLRFSTTFWGLFCLKDASSGSFDKV